jgi:hypothetical protein
MEKEYEQRLSVFSDGLARYALKQPIQIVRPFPKDFLDRLRPFLLGGLPLNTIIALNEWCTGRCYDRALLATLAFDDCNLVHAKVNSLINRNEKNSGGHAFVECGGAVYDTTAGLVFDKEFYYKVESPKIERIISKKECFNESTDLPVVIANETEQEKHSFLLTEPTYMETLLSTSEPTTLHYRPYILEELAAHKQGIDYKNFVQEEEENKLLAQTDPAALDKKFGIVRDEYGVEISRNGVPNQYYTKHNRKHFLTMTELNDFFQGSASGNVDFEKSEQLKSVLESLTSRERFLAEEAEMQKELAEIREKAAKRLSKIAKYPTAYAYQIDRD